MCTIPVIEYLTQNRRRNAGVGARGRRPALKIRSGSGSRSKTCWSQISKIDVIEFSRISSRILVWLL